MLSFIRRHRRLAAAFLLSLTLIFTVDRVRAQALPSPSEAFTVARTALQSAAAAWGTAALIVGGGSGVASVATAGGTVLGLTPIGWAAIGVAVIGAVILTSDTSGNPVAVTIGTQSIEQQPLPELTGTKAAATTPNPSGYQWYTLAPNNGGVITYISAPSNYWSTASGVTTDLTTRVLEYFKARQPLQPTWTFNNIGIVSPGYTPSGNTYQNGKCPTYAVSCVMVQFKVAATGGVESVINSLPPWAAAGWTYGTAQSNVPYQGFVIAIPLVNVGSTHAYDCGPGSSYDYMANACIQPLLAEAPEAKDNKCNISWGSDGCPVYNKTDPDCGSLNVTMSCGTSLLAPSVTVRNPTNGESMSVVRPVISTQGTVGQMEVTQRTPDPVTNTTNIKTSIINGPVAAPAPPGTAPAPSSPPVTQGSQQQVAPGTGTGTGKAASEVTVMNWPKTIEVSNMPTEIKCSNCEPVKFEVPADAPATPPVADEKVLSDSGKFMDPLKTKFAGLLNFELPTHAPGTCPKMDIKWDAWGLKVNLSNNTMCTFLEEHRSTIQSVVNLAAIVAAIIIVLGA